MKTTIITAVFLFTTALLLANGRISSPMGTEDWMVLNDEAYVNDIPFDTWKISNVAYPPDLVLDEEAYVNDIPFNTAEIAREALMNKTIKQQDESSVNDIPFSTGAIYNEILFDRLLSRWYDEKYINDIPFNTCGIARTANSENCKETIDNSSIFIEPEDLLKDYSLKIKGLEPLSFEYPF